MFLSFFFSEVNPFLLPIKLEMEANHPCRQAVKLFSNAVCRCAGSCGGCRRSRSCCRSSSTTRSGASTCAATRAAGWSKRLTTRRPVVVLRVPPRPLLRARFSRLPPPPVAARPAAARPRSRTLRYLFFPMDYICIYAR